MTPVVSGLEIDFAEVVDFRSLDAASGIGQRAFNSYGLPGHPSYLILDPQGEVLWRNFGPQTRETITTAVEGAIATVAGLQSEQVIIQGTAVPPVPTFDPQLLSRGEGVYQQYCAACHGVDLEGQPDWKSPLPDGSLRAPPHDSTGHTWHHSDEVLMEIITKGSDRAFGGSMKGFADVIDEQDRLAVLEFIKSSWGPEEREFQWWITAR